MPRGSGPKAKIENPKSKIRDRGSVLVIIMVTLLFATFALIVFMEKAHNDLIVDQRDVLTRRLRLEAYSALETTLAVLEDFRDVNQGLRSPAEGWGDPLAFASYTPSDDRKVEITFDDESGKISLPRANLQTLLNLFQGWEIPKGDAEMLADALVGWMQKSHVPTTALMLDYENGSIPFETPGRSLRSFEELRAIAKVREMFFDEDGRPNDLWKRFIGAVSLFDFQRANINGARPDTLTAVGQFDPMQRQNIQDYISGAGSFRAQGPGFFQNPGDAQRIAAGQAGGADQFAAVISALRIYVTVTDGKTQFRLTAVVAPPGGAQTITATATSQRTQASANSAQTSQKQQPNAAQNTNPNANGNSARSGQDANARNLRYPFTLLEIRENDAMPSAPPPPPS